MFENWRVWLLVLAGALAGALAPGQSPLRVKELQVDSDRNGSWETLDETELARLIGLEVEAGGTTGTVVLDSGSVGAPSLKFTSSTLTGLYLAAESNLNTIGFTSNGTRAAMLDATSATLTGSLNATGANIAGATSVNTLASTSTISAAGAVSTTAQFRAADGTAGSPSYTFTSDTDTGLSRTAANTLTIGAGGTAYDFAIDGATIGSALDVNGAATFDSTVDVAGVLDVAAGSAGAPGLTLGGDPNTGLYSSGADEIGFVAGGAERLTVGSTEAVLSVPVTGTLDVNGLVDVDNTGSSGNVFAITPTGERTAGSGGVAYGGTLTGTAGGTSSSIFVVGGRLIGNADGTGASRSVYGFNSSGDLAASEDGGGGIAWGGFSQVTGDHNGLSYGLQVRNANSGSGIGYGVDVEATSGSGTRLGVRSVTRGTAGHFETTLADNGIGVLSRTSNSSPGSGTRFFLAQSYNGGTIFAVLRNGAIGSIPYRYTLSEAAATLNPSGYRTVLVTADSTGHSFTSISDGVIDGQEVKIVCVGTNAFDISHGSGANTDLTANATATLSQGEYICLDWDATSSVWRETGGKF